VNATLSRRPVLLVLAGVSLLGTRLARAVSLDTRRSDHAGISRLSIDLAADVSIRPGPGRLTVTAERKVLQTLKVQQDGAWLRLSGIQEASDRSPVRIVLEVPALQVLHLAGALDVQGERCLAPQAELKVAGSCDVNLSGLQLQRLALQQSGSTTVLLKGQCDQLTILAQGSSDLLAAELPCRAVRIDAAGTGDFRVWAQKDLDVQLAGTATLYLRGQPRIRQSLSGTASIEAWSGEP
jgi:hypothetical protein